MNSNIASVLKAGQIIHHSKRKSLYRVVGKILVDINEEWVANIAYECILTGALYARTAKNFHNFEVKYAK